MAQLNQSYNTVFFLTFSILEYTPEPTKFEISKISIKRIILSKQFFKHEMFLTRKRVHHQEIRLQSFLDYNNLPKSSLYEPSYPQKLLFVRYLSTHFHN